MSELERPWVRLDPTELDKSTKTDVDGVEIWLSSSPYDVPEGVRSVYEPKLGHVVIEFKYLDSEPFKRDRFTKDLWLRVGKNSQRLLALELETRDMPTSAEGRRLIRAPKNDVVKAVNRAAESSSRPGSYRMVSHVLEQYWQQLLADFLA